MLAIMIQAKTIDYRDHPKLPPGSKMPFPQNQQFKIEKETFASKRKKNHIEELKEKMKQMRLAKQTFKKGSLTLASAKLPGRIALAIA